MTNIKTAVAIVLALGLYGATVTGRMPWAEGTIAIVLVGFILLAIEVRAHDDEIDRLKARVGHIKQELDEIKRASESPTRTRFVVNPVWPADEDVEPKLREELGDLQTGRMFATLATQVPHYEAASGPRRSHHFLLSYFYYRLRHFM
jgi:hypothetical protein